MRFEILFAVRFLRSLKRSALAKFTAAAAILGIASGVAASIFAQSLANGFRQEMQNKILQNTAHVVVTKANNEKILDWQGLSQQIAQVEGVKSVIATSLDNALIISKTNSTFAVLRGVHTSEISQTENQKIKIETGKNLAETTDLTVGDTAKIVSSEKEPTDASFSPIVSTVEVANVFATGLYEYDSTWIRVSLADAARLTGKKSVSACALEIVTFDIYSSNETAEHLEKMLGTEYQVLDWQQANRPLFAALALERRITIAIVSIVIFTAILNLTTTLALIMSQRRADLAVLKTCGANRESLILIFLLQGAALGMIGAIGGVLLGLTACAVCNQFGLLNLPPDVYSVNQIVLEPQTIEIFLTVLVAFVLSLAASALPALAAAEIKPLENLRN